MLLSWRELLSNKNDYVKNEYHVMDMIPIAVLMSWILFGCVPTPLVHFCIWASEFSDMNSWKGGKGI